MDVKGCLTNKSSKVWILVGEYFHRFYIFKRRVCNTWRKWSKNLESKHVPKVLTLLALSHRSPWFCYISCRAHLATFMEGQLFLGWGIPSSMLSRKFDKKNEETKKFSCYRAFTKYGLKSIFYRGMKSQMIFQEKHAPADLIVERKGQGPMPIR